MRESLFVVGLVVFGMALRSCRNVVPRKLGAFVYLAASFYALYFATGRFWGGILGVLAWFFLPWVELLTRIRRMRLPIENRLRFRVPPDPSFFPDAEEAAVSMEDAGFSGCSGIPRNARSPLCACASRAMSHFPSSR